MDAVEKFNAEYKRMKKAAKEAARKTRQTGVSSQSQAGTTLTGLLSTTT